MDVFQRAASFPPEPRSGIFRKARRIEALHPAALHPAALHPAALAAAVCGAACVDLALVVLAGLPTRPPASTVLSAAGVRTEPGSRLLAWLAASDEAGPLAVPDRAQPLVRADRVLAVPIATPVVQVGALATPLVPDWRRVLGRLRTLASDFALAAEMADRRAQIESLRAD